MKHSADSNLGQSIRSGSQWLVTGGIGNRILEFGIGVVLARLLLPADFGLLVTVQVFTGIAGFFSNAGMSAALIHAKDLQARHIKVAFTLQLLTGSVIYAFFFVTAPWFAGWYDQPLYTDLMRATALTFLIRPFTATAGAQLSRDMRFRAQTILTFVSGAITGCTSIGLAHLGFGVWSLVLSGLAGSLFNALTLSVTAGWMPGLAFDKDVARSLGGYGAKVATADFLSYVRSQISNFLLSRLSTPAAVGLFNKADSLALIPLTTISGAVYQPTFRALSAVQDNLEKSKYIYFRAITLVLVYTLPFYVGLYWLAGSFIGAVYGEKWMGSATPLQILALGGLFRCVINQSGAIIAAQKRLGAEIFILAENVVLLGISIVIGSRWGLDGVAWGFLASTLHLFTRMSLLANRCVHAKPADLLKAALPALKLNAILCTALFAADRAYFGTVEPDHPMLYLLGMSALGGLAYGVGFLFLPIVELETEVARWKNKLGLARPESRKAVPASRPNLPRRRQTRPWLAALGVTAGLLATLGLIHWLWCPLDELWSKGRLLIDRALG